MTSPISGSVNAVLARCLVDPAFLDRLALEPSASLADLPLDERTRSELAALDWSRVRAFGGFITKVQHNDLWPVLPYTRALLKAHRREIALFTAYRPTYLRLRAAGATREAKIRAFLLFLANDRTAAQCAGLLDVARHEESRWLAETALQGSQDLPDAGPGCDIQTGPGRSSSALVPVVRGFLRTASFASDPESAIAAVNRGQPLAGAEASEPRWLGYWVCPRGDRVRLLELDATAVRVLDAVNGSRSLASIARRSGARLGTVREVLAAAQTQGVVAARALLEQTHAPHSC